MDSQRFMEIIHRQLGVCEDVLFDKGDEYVGEEPDRLHNFKQAANVMGITPRQVLAGFMAKHTVSIYDMMMAKNDFTPEKWTEKITDHINYLLILQCVLEDERTKEAVSTINELIGVTDTRNPHFNIPRPFGDDSITIADIGKTYIVTTSGLKELHPLRDYNTAPGNLVNNTTVKEENA